MIAFTGHRDTWSGTGRRGRRWRITRVYTGWHLEFRDPGDTYPTNAGVHSSLEAAQREAGR